MPRVQSLADAVSSHPCRCKNKADASDFDTMISDLYLTLSQKVVLMLAIAQEPTSDAYLKAKSKFVATPMQTQSVFEKPISRKKDKPKKDPKPSTFEQTYDLYKAGSTPEQIAEMRGLTLNTNHIRALDKIC